MEDGETLTLETLNKAEDWYLQAEPEAQPIRADVFSQIIAAARAHLEQQRRKPVCPCNSCNPQPPQQREDDGPSDIRGDRRGSGASVADPGELATIEAADEKAAVAVTPTQREDDGLRPLPTPLLKKLMSKTPTPSSTVEPLPYPWNILGHPGDSVQVGPGGAKLIRHDEPAPDAGCMPFSDGSMWYEQPKPAPDAGLVWRLKQWNGYNGQQLMNEAAAALEAKDAEIERLRKGWEQCREEKVEAQLLGEAQAAEIELHTNAWIDAEDRVQDALAEIKRLNSVIDFAQAEIAKMAAEITAHKKIAERFELPCVYDARVRHRTFSPQTQYPGDYPDTEVATYCTVHGWNCPNLKGQT